METTAEVTGATRFRGHGDAGPRRTVSLRVAARGGAADVSEVIAAIDWVVRHRRGGELDIRVLNRSVGTDGVQDDRVDPLVFSAEVEWRSGVAMIRRPHGSGGFPGRRSSVR